MYGASHSFKWLEAYEPECEEPPTAVHEDRSQEEDGDLPEVDQSRQSTDGSRSLGDDSYFRLPDIRWGRQVTDEYWPTWEGESKFPGPPTEEMIAPTRKLSMMDKVKGLTSDTPKTSESSNSSQMGAVYTFASKTGPFAKAKESDAGHDISFYGYSEKPCSWASNASTNFGDIPLEPYSFTSSCSTSTMVAAGSSFTSTGSNADNADEEPRPSTELALRALAAAVDFVSPKVSDSNQKPHGHRRKQGGSLIDLALQKQEKELRQQQRLQMKQQMKLNREKKSLIDLAAEERDRQLQQQQQSRNGEKASAASGTRFCTQCGGSCQPTFKFCRFCGGEVV
jgi:hypothetical protein